MNAKIVQHVIEPSLIQAISNGKEIVDLTGSLLKQGISHWKHSNRTIQFHAPPKHPKNTHIPFFPTDTTYEYARIGCQIVSLGDLVTIGSGTELKLSKIFCRNNDLMLQGKLYESGDILTVHVKEFRQRFDPCFDIALLFNIQAQCDWNGDPIYRGEARVNFK